MEHVALYRLYRPMNFDDIVEQEHAVSALRQSVLSGKIGKYIVTARRKGNDWYVGAMTDWTPRDLEIDLSFLPQGTWRAEVFKDGKNAEKAARDYVREEMILRPDGPITVHLAPGGGWAAKLTKK